jgi:hypothetical protein
MNGEYAIMPLMLAYPRIPMKPMRLSCVVSDGTRRAVLSPDSWFRPSSSSLNIFIDPSWSWKTWENFIREISIKKF